MCEYLTSLPPDTKKEAIAQKFISLWDSYQVDEYVQCIQSIAKYPNLNNLLSSYKLTDPNSSGLDVAIFNAVLKRKFCPISLVLVFSFDNNLIFASAKSSVWERLKLLYEWNRYDIAKSILVNEPDWVE